MKSLLIREPSDEDLARVHERVRNRPPGRMLDLARLVLTPPVRLLYRPRCVNTEVIPEQGAAIIAANHFSYVDPPILVYCLRRRARFMAWAGLYRGPLRFFIPYLGAFPVRLGVRDEEAIATAHAILGGGGVVVLYPEGGRSPPGQIREPKSGVGRLALQCGAPVIPAAIAGSEEARDWWKLHFPVITVRFGEPRTFDRVENPTREQAHAVAVEVFDEVKRLYAEETRRRKGRAAA